jgi:hypothetical protein
MLTQSWRRIVRHSAAVLPLVLMTSCGGDSSPTGPSVETSFLNGRWTGILTISRTGEPDISGPTTWTFVLNPGSGGRVFQTTIESQNAWFPVSTTTTTALLPAATPPTQLATHGTYPSPRGCRGDFGSDGQVETRTIDASFDGVDCAGQVFGGRVRLTKQ